MIEVARMTIIDATIIAIMAVVIKASSNVRSVYLPSVCLYFIARADRSCVIGSISASIYFFMYVVSGSNDITLFGSLSEDRLSSIPF
jgi:hypothetical protein